MLRTSHLYYISIKKPMIFFLLLELFSTSVLPCFLFNCNHRLHHHHHHLGLLLNLIWLYLIQTTYKSSSPFSFTPTTKLSSTTWYQSFSTSCSWSTYGVDVSLSNVFSTSSQRETRPTLNKNIHINSWRDFFFRVRILWPGKTLCFHISWLKVHIG